MSFLMAHDQGGLRLTGKIARGSTLSLHITAFILKRLLPEIISVRRNRHPLPCCTLLTVLHNENTHFI